MEIELKSAGRLASRIASAYIAKVQDEEGDGLCDLATTSSYGFCLELSLSSDGVWSFDDTDIKFVETEEAAPARTLPIRFGIMGYMPETAFVKPNDPVRKIDALVKLW